MQPQLPRDTEDGMLTCAVPLSSFFYYYFSSTNNHWRLTDKRSSFFLSAVDLWLFT